MSRVPVTELEETGQTAAVVRVDGMPVAVLGIADRTRSAAAAAVARITAVTRHPLPSVLLTGDNLLPPGRHSTWMLSVTAGHGV